MNSNTKRILIILAVVGLLAGGSIAWAQMGPGGPGTNAGAGPVGGYGCAMMGGGTGGFSPGFIAQDAQGASQAAGQYLDATWRNPDLVVKEVMTFSNHFYVQIKEASTGIGAMELLVDRVTGGVHPEPGPNMMWNAKYDHMGRGHGHMGGWNQQAPTAQMPVTREQAVQLAQQFLASYIPGASVTDEITTFYGYYTVDLQRDGQIFGMLSVNGTTGQVWYHSWHGAFEGMEEF